MVYCTLCKEVKKRVRWPRYGPELNQALSRVLFWHPCMYSNLFFIGFSRPPQHVRRCVTSSWCFLHLLPVTVYRTRTRKAETKPPSPRTGHYHGALGTRYADERWLFSLLCTEGNPGNPRLLYLRLLGTLVIQSSAVWNKLIQCNPMGGDEGGIP